MLTNGSNDVRSLIVGFIEEYTIVPIKNELDDSAKILEYIDSFSFVELVQHLDDTLGVQIDFSEAGPEDLTFLGRFTSFVERILD